MKTRLPFIGSIGQWEGLIARTPLDRELVVFKYSPMCGMSFMADRQVRRWLKDIGEPEVDIYMVDVLADRDVSQHIESHFGIRHESPQVLWIDANGAIRWHGSHRDVSRKNLARLYASRAGSSAN